MATVHCITIRSTSIRRPPLVTAGKIIVHYGDLTQPRLGLVEAQATAIFNDADMVIHNGANVSSSRITRPFVEPTWIRPSGCSS